MASKRASAMAAIAMIALVGISSSLVQAAQTPAAAAAKTTAAVSIMATAAAAESSSLADPSATPSPLPLAPAEEQERESSMALFLVLFLLIFSFFVSYYLRVKRITAIHETIVGLFAGMLVGAVLRIGPGQQVQNMLSFSNTIMLNVLLPPIILSSGYELRQEQFFRNFGIILAFALAGTFISAIVIGVLVWLWSLADFTISLSLLECLIFGSTLSATDPVTILAIFNTKKVDPTLYSIIFGESLLNDAVSIVMFETLQTFRGQTVTFGSIFHGIGLFMIVFTTSLALGVIFGLSCSLLLKHTRLGMYPQLESSLVALIAYTSYFFSNAVTMSGIVSLLFCGITLKHYAYHNMSRRTQKATKYTFQTLASLSENFIFIYLGLSLFTQEGLEFKPLFILVTVGVIALSRYAAVFPIASIINLIRRTRNSRRAARSGGGGVPRTGREEELSREYQIMLFWAGLRGAVGFALSAGIEGKNATALQTTVLVTIVLTLIFFGGTTSQMLDILKIRTGVQDDDGDSSEEEGDDMVLGARRSKSYQRGHSRRGSWLGGGSSQDAAGYRDQDSLISKNKRASYSANGAKVGTSRSLHGTSADGGRFSYDEGSDSQGSDVLPLAPGQDSPDGVHRLSSDAFPEAFAGSPRTQRGARALFERGALIMRDGQWFQRIDDRYLKPYFSNAVASRKHEERRSMRIASRSEGAIDPSLLHEGGSDSPSRSYPGTPPRSTVGSTSASRTPNRFSMPAMTDERALWEAEALHREPDADVYSPTVLDEGGLGNDYVSAVSSGRATPSMNGGNGGAGGGGVGGIGNAGLDVTNGGSGAAGGQTGNGLGFGSGFRRMASVNAAGDDSGENLHVSHASRSAGGGGGGLMGAFAPQ